MATDEINLIKKQKYIKHNEAIKILINDKKAKYTTNNNELLDKNIDLEMFLKISYIDFYNIDVNYLVYLTHKDRFKFLLLSYTFINYYNNRIINIEQYSKYYDFVNQYYRAEVKLFKSEQIYNKKRHAIFQLYKKILFYSSFKFNYTIIEYDTPSKNIAERLTYIETYINFRESSKNQSKKEVKESGIKNFIPLDNFAEMEEYSNYILKNKPNRIYECVFVDNNFLRSRIFDHHLTYRHIYTYYLNIGKALKQLEYGGTLLFDIAKTSMTPLWHNLIRTLAYLFSNYKINYEWDHPNSNVILLEFNGLLNHPQCEIIANEWIEFGLKYYVFGYYDLDDIVGYLIKKPNTFFNIDEFIKSNEYNEIKSNIKWICPTFNIIEYKFQYIIDKNAKDESIYNTIITILNNNYSDYMRWINGCFYEYKYLNSNSDKNLYLENIYKSHIITEIKQLLEYNIEFDYSLIEFVQDNVKFNLKKLLLLRNGVVKKLTSKDNSKKYISTICTKYNFSEIINITQICSQKQNTFYNSLKQNYPKNYQDIKRKLEKTYSGITNKLINYLQKNSNTKYTPEYLIINDIFNKFSTKLKIQKTMESGNLSIFHLNEPQGQWASFFTNKCGNKLKWKSQVIDCYNPINILKYGQNILNADTIKFYNKYNFNLELLDDLTGDLSNINNLETLSNYYDANFDIITGGLDIKMFYDNNFKLTIKMEEIYMQEVAQLLGVINLLKKGGNCIIKNIGNYSYNNDMIKMQINLIYNYVCLFEEVILYKPVVCDAQYNDYFIIGINFSIDKELQPKNQLTKYMNYLLDRIYKGEKIEKCLYLKKLDKNVIENIIDFVIDITKQNIATYDIASILIGCDKYKNIEYKKKMECNVSKKKWYSVQIDEWIKEQNI
jgi:hypothetical protein